MKKLLLNFIFVVFFTASFLLSSAQTPISVTFKPGPEIGQDAHIVYSKDDCSPNGGSEIPGNVNTPSAANITISAWTWYINGCTEAYSRGLIKFDELGMIPSDAVIVSAELKLYGINEEDGGANNHYPGTPYPNTNPSYIQMITSEWEENTVTWHTQPTTTTANQISLPYTNSKYNWDFSDNSTNLVAMIQHMVSNPDLNFGFLIKLQTEAYYRSFSIASSDHHDPELWPELTVEYTIPCNSEFTYCSSSNSNTYTFNSFGPESNNMWFVNNIFRSNSPVFEYDLPVGTNNVCHYLIERTTGEMCVTCVDICVSQKSTLKNTKTVDEIMKIMQNQTLTEDIDINKNFNSEIYPNPSSEEWNIKINAYEDDNILLDLKDISGKTIRTENKYISKGENIFTIDCKNLNTGIYLLVIISKDKEESHKLIKK